jgi:hypothetical protein
VFHYVARTRESVILDDALAQNPFSADEYLGKKHVRSVLCLPLVKQSKLIGVLHLENNLASHVFTAARISVLEVLASQAAISLENARLYSDLREREARIRRLVDSNIVGIVIWDVQGRAALGSPPRMRTGCSTPSSPQNPVAWGWDSRSAVRSWKITGVGCGPRPTYPTVLRFNLPCRCTQTPRREAAPVSRPKEQEAAPERRRGIGYRCQVFGQTSS